MRRVSRVAGARVATREDALEAELSFARLEVSSLKAAMGVLNEELKRAKDELKMLRELRTQDEDWEVVSNDGR